MFQHIPQKKEYRKRTGGFTFVETLVAIAVLLLAIAGPLFLASQGLRAARIARDQVNANYLAQEAIEYIRYKRDTNVLQNNDWMTLLSPCVEPNACVLDIFTNTITNCTDKGGCPVLFHEGTGKYGYGDDDGFLEGGTIPSDWIATKFTRDITITDIVAGREAEIAVTVSWQDGMIERSYTLRENILNWQE